MRKIKLQGFRQAARYTISIAINHFLKKFFKNGILICIILVLALLFKAGELVSGLERLAMV